ncbi:hypothetical protein P153DRAFT_365340 [Dothidotthia symphoricarpi CBS 119687]|uniref:Uncharacterized protein n=1 Tax=Dothidotthia symphoricarpi CBS 119687 TaxID=1392245 RepID=A0A6A6AKM4_9PLEO|nr:uncharacterized protein P153DRAFT_365340 [Dothidotthia symphoricarpi CBS 119687]KAF2131783.1 hypothetical protein P153DRAFT_365340 [Dothidotthia symphoricarpi CBS 119687]
MAASPTARMTHSVNPHMHASYSHHFSPASTTGSDSSYSRPSMSRRQDPKVPKRPKPKRPSSNSTNGKPAPNVGFTFITATEPDGFKTPENMAVVRKIAMGNFLHERDMISRESSELNSEDSTLSHGSQEGTPQPSDPGDTAKLGVGEPLRLRKPSSLAKYTNLNNHRQPTSRPGTQLVKHQPLAGSGLLVSPMIEPPRTGVLLDYDEHPTPLFASFGMPFDPFNSMHQASHPAVFVEELKHYCSQEFGTRAMGQHWVKFIIKTPRAFLSTLSIASAHRDAWSGKDVETVQTLALRQEIIQLIRQTLRNSDECVDDDSIVALTQLIVSEVIACEESATEVHEKGLVAMMEKRGGLNRLDWRLACTVSWVTLVAAILRETTPHTMYSDFCTSQSRKKHPPNATIPESPIYRPRCRFETLERSNKCDKRAENLLHEAHEVIRLFLDVRKHDRPNSAKLRTLCEKICDEQVYPSAAKLQLTDVLTPRDWIYEAIRITATIQATAILKRVPLSQALKDAASDSKSLSSLDTASTASRSDDSLVSPMSFLPNLWGSSSSAATASPSFGQPLPFSHNTPHSSITSISSSSSFDWGSFQSRPSIDSMPSTRPSIGSMASSRPSIASKASSFSEPSYFPKFRAPVPRSHNPEPTPATLLTSVKIALNNSGLSDCWSDLAGVLLWVSLTVGASSRKEDKVLKRWFAALSMRATIMLCHEHPEAINATMLKMSEVIEALEVEEKGKTVVKEAKKRKF